jgi:hypothetical protein
MLLYADTTAQEREGADDRRRKMKAYVENLAQEKNSISLELTKVSQCFT